MLTGILFDIQRFSVHDGPGIRTTVFMKGCPLRCRWCHNPEGLSAQPQLQFFQDACLSCGACQTRTHLSDALNCPADALRICGREVDEDEVMREIQRDRVFYADNGGVTFSGGECLLQADFVAAVLSRVKGMGLHTAIDTSGYVPWREIEKTVDVCDLYLYDVKCFSPDVHKAYTGVDNALILQNLKRLSGMGKDIWIRIPVIPDFNNNEKEMTDIADLIASLPLSSSRSRSSVRQVTLMPYHTLGVSKYRTLGMECPYNTEKRITDSELAAYRRIFEDRHIPIV